METIRAITNAQRAGAYYVRIQAMAVKHHISLEQEFDEHDETDARYVMILDDVLPVASGRMFPAGEDAMQFGRIVVLPEYRHRGLGSQIIRGLEEWAAELGYGKVILESRDNKVAFYEKLGYAGDPAKVIYEEPFQCVMMEKRLKPAGTEESARCAE